MKELTAALVTASSQRDFEVAAVESVQVAGLQTEVRALPKQAAEAVTHQSEVANVESEQMLALRSRIGQELRPCLNTVNEHSEDLVRRVDVSKYNIIIINSPTDS